ncbi:LysM peptidoglycan-binding domain-containing protein [Microbacterium oryzae]|uniref:LysM peptidoglycan-binding domain-containing protein n=1 Tax=Microbacterium oryzae TaxID=743009 RepID=UPI0025B1324B|nr:LysM peptidoglycan-binding domain-containing protein [Microbacterium oryzae]MDN3311909.1 LysM peptidoglycan-binding domain-containing protein [Microbacterium oryzae]
MAVTGAIAVTLGAPAAASAVEKPREGVRHLPADLGHTDGSLAVAANAHAVRTPTATAGVTVHQAAAAITSYTVQPGDTITGIAIRHGLRTVDVLTWNGLGWSSTIYPGQSIRLTASSAGASQDASATAAKPAAVIQGEARTQHHVVTSGDTVWSIAQRYGSSVDRIISLNKLGSDALIFVGQKLAVADNAVAVPAQQQEATSEAPAVQEAPAAPQTESYIVQAGDTLWAIAQKHGVSVSELLAANGLNGSSIIYPGQKIALPRAGGAPAPQSAPQAQQQSEAPQSIYDIPTDQLSASLNAPQTENAQMIIRIGRELGISDKGIAIALATAMVESGLRNLDWGDRDSLGLFQQRPSTGWGSEEQILNRDYSIRVFFGGAGDPNGSTTRGLRDIAGWQDMDFGQAAQTVQISAFPDRYGRWETQAYSWLAQLG